MNNKMKLIFLDTETTGTDIKTDRLCQLCYKVGDEIRAEYFKPPIPIPIDATSVHHITNKMVADKPIFQGSEMHKDLEEKFKDHIAVIHNAPFDSGILKNEGIEIPRVICTLRVTKHLDEDDVIPKHNLQFLRYYFGLELDAPAHDAKGDVIVLHAVFQKLLAKMMEKIPDEVKAIEEMVRISSRPALMKRFKFGKYKDQKISDVVKTDRGYLEWMLKEQIKKGEGESDLALSLKEYLK